MPPTGFRDPRRSTPVPLRVAIALEDGPRSFSCEGVTVVVNLHGALIATAIGLSAGATISIHVHLTDKQSAARVVYIAPENPLHCGIERRRLKTSGECLCRPMTGKIVPWVVEREVARSSPCQPYFRLELDPTIAGI